MATRPIVPNKDGEGSLGVKGLKYGSVYTKLLDSDSIESKNVVINHSLSIQGSSTVPTPEEGYNGNAIVNGAYVQNELSKATGNIKEVTDGLSDEIEGIKHDYVTKYYADETYFKAGDYRIVTWDEIEEMFSGSALPEDEDTTSEETTSKNVANS